ATRDLTIAADLNASIDSSLTSSGSYSGAWKVGVSQNGVRAVDGVGINLYGPTVAGSNVTYTDGNGTSNTIVSNTLYQSLTLAGSLADNAVLNVSTDASTPLKGEVIATGGSASNQYDKLPVLVFDVNADKDNVTIKDLTAKVYVTGSGAASASTAYLYDGSTLINSAAISSGSASFNNINYVVPSGTTKALTLKVDVTSANGTLNTVTAGVATSTSADITALNSQGSTVTVSGSATGNGQNVRKYGVEVALVGTPTVTTSGVPESSATNNLSTSTMTATFNVQVTARGEAIDFGTTASDTPMFTNTTVSFKVYKNGAYAGTISANATSTSFATPSS
ncbi:MAG: hypothetical protein M1459_02385, partial [Patescibacteria group bacterium]|nr:hypothetical protein [Patescibacteria group bacterium]